MRTCLRILFFWGMLLPLLWGQKKSAYEKEWREIDSLERIGLPKSALEATEKLYARMQLAPQNERQETEELRLLLYLCKYEMRLEEEGEEKAIQRWEAESEKATGAKQALMRSMLAELYNNYLSQNLAKFSARTATAANFRQDDMRTWDVQRMTRRIFELYKLSLLAPETRKISLSAYADLLSGAAGNIDLQPFLYDLLANRALEFYMSGFTHLTQPAYKFYIEQPAALGGAAEFMGAKFSSPDTLSGQFQAVLTWQELLRFHAQDKDKSAFVYADLRRLQYMREAAVSTDKDARYIAQLEALAKAYPKLEITAQVIYQTAVYWADMGSKYKAAQGDAYRWEKKKAVDIINRAIGKYPRSTVGAKNLLALKNLLTEKSFSVKTEQVTPIGQNILVSIEYQNVPALHYRIIERTQAVADSIFKLYGQHLIAHLAKLPALKSGTWQLPDEKDYQAHRTEAMLEGMKSGRYILLLSYDKNFKATEGNAISYATFGVSDISYITRSVEGRQSFYVVNRRTGAPMEGVEAEFSAQYYHEKNYTYYWKSVSTLKTDKNGFVMAPDPATIASSTSGRSYGTFRVAFRTNAGDVLDSESATFSQHLYRPEKRSYQTTHFFTDRAIYRPGQTVYFKGLMTSNDETGKNPKIIPNQKTTVTFYDVNNQKVASVEVKTNEYGSYQGSFIAPASGLTGQMHLHDAVSSARKYFRVEEYKRPKFEVKMLPVDKAYKIGEKISAKGVATAYAGNKIDGAKVQYRVQRRANFPYWDWRRGYNLYNQSGQEIAFGETKTDGNGEFVIDFEALPDRSIAAADKPQFSYEVTADVTDAAGETRSTVFTLRVGYVSMLANIGISQNENYSQETGKPLKISSSNLNGQYEAAKGTITIEQLQQPAQVYHSRHWEAPDYFMIAEAEFRAAFPQLPYKGEHLPQNWAVKKQMLKTDFDTEKSKEFDLKALAAAWEQGTYKITFSTADKYGEKIEIQRIFCLYSEKANTTPSPSALYSRQSTYTGEPSETLQIDFGAHSKDAYVLVQIEQEGILLMSEWVQPKGRKSIPIALEEKHRGGLFVQFVSVQESRYYSENVALRVPWTNKELKIEYESFRDKLLPGQEEEWRIKISGSKGDLVAAEILATMYDASLDAFAANDFRLSLWYSNYARFSLQTGFGFSYNHANQWSEKFNAEIEGGEYELARLRWFGFYLNPYYRMSDREGGYTYNWRSEEERTEKKAEERPNYHNLQNPPPPPPAPAPDPSSPKGRGGTAQRSENGGTGTYAFAFDGGGGGSADKDADFSSVQVRSNLNETVFFFPQIQTDKDGNIILKFKMNEALTKWKFMLLAHTKDLAVGSSTKEVITQKDLMVQPNAPRFFRQSDEIEFSAKIANLTDKKISGKVALQLFDASTMKPIDADFGNGNNTLDFSVEAARSVGISWKLKVPADWTNAISFRAIAKAGDFSDGEENSLPVLSNRMLVTETMPLPVRAGQTKTFNFARMAEVSKSTTMRQHAYTLEFTQNPAWYAVQALPYLMEYPYECTEQVFSRFYANSLSSSIANAQPRIRQVFEQWKNIDPNALKSNLHKNQELKTALLEETPWVLAAESEEQQKRNIGLLFDLHRMADEQGKARDKMLDRQLPNGGFSWFPGGRDDWYISQYIVEGMGQLRLMNVKAVSEDPKISSMNAKALQYIDEQIDRHYRDLMESIRRYKGNPDDDHLSQIAAHYLYARSFFPEIKIESKGTQEAISYFEQQARKYWLQKPLYTQGMLALAFHRKQDKVLPAAIVQSLKENALNSEEMGMYWKYPSGYSWHELPIETHALMIAVFDEVANDQKAVDDLKTWLLKAKQTTHWKTTKATASACYALLRRGADFLAESKPIAITIGGAPLDMSKIPQEAGTGYFKKAWKGEEIKPEMSKIVVSNPNKVVAWGAIYWQYFEQMDKITHFKETPLKINKQLFKEVRSAEGLKLLPLDEKTKLQVGDLIKVRIEIFVDRDMEYVHLKDMRASGFEPVNVLSAYKYQGGLGYYESTRDLGTHFFISYLSKGTYVFEYPLRVQHKGDFSNGITTIQCMYAPEFTAHSEGLRIRVE